MSGDILLVGEVYVDFTLPKPSADAKLRLGGVVHAARGLWAVGARYSVAAACPSYLVDQVRDFLDHHGCEEFIWLADVTGAPNVMAIGDQTELADQAYQDILRDAKFVRYLEGAERLKTYKDCLVFPGSFNLPALRDFLCDDVRASFDIAYDVPELGLLDAYRGNISAIITSTSSSLFLKTASLDFSDFLEELRAFGPQSVLLKENRGGSRVFDMQSDEVEEIPAQLVETINSVGVGDVYSAVFVSMLGAGAIDAAWKAARAATCYAQTTYPDDFKRDVQRSFKLTMEELRGLGGTSLPWHARQEFQIYFAAPDFSYVDRKHIEDALSALSYHNFRVRRPVLENGELNPESQLHEMQSAYQADLAMLSECDLVFALPYGRDPGTLVEVGLALAANTPVVTYDPLSENANTMVMAGSTVYSESLNLCLNGVFESLSRVRASQA